MSVLLLWIMLAVYLWRMLYVFPHAPMQVNEHAPFIGLLQLFFRSVSSFMAILQVHELFIKISLSDEVEISACEKM